MTGPNHLLTVTDEAVPPAAFSRLHRKLRQIGDGASYWRTFWHPIDAPPANAVEAVIADLRHHLPPSPRRIQGVEWWIGRTFTTDVKLDFHHDRDLRLFEETGRLSHPVWSSVLFFNRVRGGSLFVTNQRLRREGDALVVRPREAQSFGSVRPSPNRFAVFPGFCFHGVLDANDQPPVGRVPGPRGRARLTLVVNWWDRHPRDVKRWSESRAYRELKEPGATRRPILRLPGRHPQRRRKRP